MVYGVYGDLTLIHPKPYSIYLSGTIVFVSSILGKGSLLGGCGLDDHDDEITSSVAQGDQLYSAWALLFGGWPKFRGPSSWCPCNIVLWGGEMHYTCRRNPCFRTESPKPRLQTRKTMKDSCHHSSNLWAGFFTPCMASLEYPRRFRESSSLWRAMQVCSAAPYCE